MNRRAKGAVLGALTMLLSGCWWPGAADRPDEETGPSLDKVLAGLLQSHRADVEVTVRARSLRIPPVDMAVEMKGTHSASPAQGATDLDLPAVSMTIELPTGDERVRNGAVRVVFMKDGTYVRNTLQSPEWRTLRPGVMIRGVDGYDPTETAQLVQTTLAREMFLDSGEVTRPSPSPVATGGQNLHQWTVTCNMSYACLAKSPDARAAALKVYPASAVTELKLTGDAQDRPRKLEIKSEFPLDGENAAHGMTLTFRAALTFRDLGRQVVISPPPA